MKKLQSNFTTPEQSKRLLELGMPANSADCVYIVYNEGTDKEYYTLSVPMPHQSPVTEIVEKGNKDYAKGNVTFYYCWSVGRLTELHEILFPQYKNFIIERDDVTLISRMVRYYEIGAEQEVLDFSKLED